MRWLRQVALISVAATTWACAGLGREPAPMTAIQPGASADFDFLVGRDLELQGDAPGALEAYLRAVEKDPDAPYLHRRVAELAAQQGHFDQSLEHAERVYELDPDDVDSRLFLATLYRIRKEPERVFAILEDPETGLPVNTDAALRLYSIHYEAGRMDEALKLGIWVLEQEPRGLRGYLAVGAVRERQEEYDELERVLREALDLHPGNLTIYNQLARSRRDRGDHEGEIAAYREILDHYPHHQSTLFSLADSQIRLNQVAAAKETLEEAERYHPGDARASVRLGLLEFQEQNYKAAAPHFERALAVEPAEHEFAYFLGLTRIRSDEDDLARDAFERIPETHSRYSDARTQIAAILESRGQFQEALVEVERARNKESTRALELYAARLQSKAGDIDGAIAFLSGLLRETPGDDELLYNLGVIYGEAKQFDESLRYMHMALDANPENAAALNYVGYTWTERGENLDHAEEMIRRALALRPDDGYITDSLGWVYYMRAQPLLDRGELQDAHDLLHSAVRELEKAAQLTGGDPVISEHLGDVYLKLEEKKRALDSYREALDQEPRPEEQPRLREKYEKLQRELGVQ